MALDRCGRDIHYLRISLTDRCNLRCSYCMPEDIPFQRADALMTALAGLTLDKPWQIRDIELMPFGSNAARMQAEMVREDELHQIIEAHFGPLKAEPHTPHGDARSYRVPGAVGTLGFISSISDPFCAGCNRIRLTADGHLRLCLLRDGEVDLLTPCVAAHRAKRSRISSRR